jgi:hypothetical protein
MRQAGWSQHYRQKILFPARTKKDNMSDLIVMVESKIWPDKTDLLSLIMGSPGLEKVSEVGRSLTWDLLGLEIVAYDEPDLDDEPKIPFSKFRTGISLGMPTRLHSEQSEAFRMALGVVLVLYLRDKLGTDIRLFEDLETEITVP